jgi:hypothetical protein
MRFAADLTEEDDPWGLSSALSASRTPVGATKPNGRIVGTSTKLEKPYLRLTTFPNVQNVRPQPILEKALQHVKTEYKINQNFEWANDQLKSIRQDITVQGIRTDFCLEVYEAHARILLENGDLSEFNQCQSMIRNITKGKDIWLEHEEDHERMSNGKLLRQTAQHSDEFCAYQLLYTIVQNSWSDFNKALGEAADISGPSSQHAFQVVQSVIHNNYRLFFRLYRSSPNLSAYLMDFLVKRVRAEAYDRIIASFRPTLDIEYFRDALQFQDSGEATEFLNNSGAVYVQDSEAKWLVDCKASYARLQRFAKVKSR